MVPRKVIIDCDPGQDDAVALFLAMASPGELDILGVTTVAGNVPLALTQRNARMMCDIAGRRDMRVFAGCERPLRRDPITAEYIHGATGIDGVDVFEPETPLQEQHAVDFIVDTLRNEVSVTLIPTGPMTNFAAAIEREPSILESVEQIVSMGGAMREGGNRSPSAEFNILADPHAAEIVYDCGRPVTAMGLDVTHRVLSTRERVARIRELGNDVAMATAGMLSFFHRYDTKKYGSEGAPLHDPCTVAWLLEPGLFETRRCNVSVETESELTIGHTAVDFWHVTDRPHNVDWAYTVDADGFYDLLVERVARFGD
ncbi:MAG: nucleoside hydrolase [Gammaproteobacteria bacterium]|nr:nucleoside hydrolase [Gammaproteobacteria bacterium]NNF49790.1 nucleoside hydrolase [Woeseiaceae bacterium]MBT8094054.1 nucleoside hydrolase [Gammaproteobacteria bacterium]MBT8105713.1 nucleoside hydrolase [Gammaproteobacteria bacterium]NNK25727.1 nucleoside hydrolase [Woeseiaceae bacterium]